MILVEIQVRIKIMQFTIDGKIASFNERNRRASDYLQDDQRDRQTQEASCSCELGDKKIVLEAARSFSVVVYLQKLFSWYACLGADDSQGSALDFVMVGQR